MVTAAEAQEILDEPKIIAVNLEWRSDNRSFRLTATVLAEESENLLSLRGYIGRKNRSFALLFKNTPIRKYTVHSRHRDPVTRIVFTQPHKHT